MLSDAFEAIQGLLGEPPFTQLKDDSDSAAKKSDDPATTTVVTKNVVLADGTYASITSTETVGGSGGAEAEKMPHLRRLVSAGDILLGTVVGVTLTKISLKLGNVAGGVHSS